ncbi:hypothetical protein THTE_3242 [Thermogutta terrifontis]|uniref:Uncharacterized protein n=1 Tax=Thermogutta terrifontis TaxID=1331910 RepID=A0A286RIR4_9BACT|nr:hypothetical protein THTE_3242 [Thermogutta terrifontis]
MVVEPVENTFLEKAFGVIWRIVAICESLESQLLYSIWTTPP